MAIKINTSVFSSSDIREALDVISQVGSRRKLGIVRWDNVLDMYSFSGTVVVPVKIGSRVFREPFYFVVEKVNERESIRIKPVKGDQWSMGEVYGFFGLYDFDDFMPDMPILVVEGLSDWAVWKKYYKYTVASLTAWVGYRQAFFLSNLSKNIFLGYDNDETGAANRSKNIELLKKLSVNTGTIFPPNKDWGKMYENEFSRGLMDTIATGFLEKVNLINRHLLR